MNKIVYILIIITAVNYCSRACGPHYDPDHEYYNLFMQEIIDDPVYKPFLFTSSLGFYASDNSVFPNENIQQWQEYLKISYDDAYYLVFKSKREDIENAVKGEPTDERLSFITKEFAEYYKDAILYLRRAKIMEPYMYIIPNEDGWYYSPPKTVKDLNYDDATAGMINTWHSARDKDIKLRWGYQLVRFAHYYRKYQEAIDFFDTYVEPLDYRPAMYYHALSQKAGAQLGLGESGEGNYNFLQVFVYSRDLKITAVQSIQLSGNPDWDHLLSLCKNDDERNNAYLLLGYNSFNNPLNEIEKITAVSPDAIQAKVLMARTVNIIERTNIPIYYWSDPQPENERYPLIKSEGFVDEAISCALKVLDHPELKETDFWQISLSYLYFLKQDFTSAREYLVKINTSSDIYIHQKENLALYIDICEPQEITSSIETTLYAKYADVFKLETEDPYYLSPEDYNTYSTHHFAIDVLANRYFLQKDYAKSFLMNNTLETIEDNPQPELLKQLEAFHKKQNKNDFEKYIAGKLTIPDIRNLKQLDSYFGYLWGIVYLTEGDFKKARSSFRRINPEELQPDINYGIFGANIAECFMCDEEYLMKKEYIDEFKYIYPQMDYLQLTEALIKLQKAGKKKNQRAAKANYLLGNFYYNTTRTGHYRELLRFDSDNSFTSYKYSNMEEPDIFKRIYFKNYNYYYKNVVSESFRYLEKAYTQAKDDELKARIIFALSKCEQEEYYDNNIKGYTYSPLKDPYISERKYFNELMKYKDTHYFYDVENTCRYFEYFVNRSFSKQGV